MAHSEYLCRTRRIFEIGINGFLGIEIVRLHHEISQIPETYIVEQIPGLDERGWGRSPSES